MAAKASVAGRTRPTKRGGHGAIPRPDPIWAPFPLTEIGLAVGLFMFAIGVEASNARVMTIGALVLGVVVGEMCLREHFTGFRSHAILLAALTVVAGHTAVVFAVTDAFAGPVSLAVDLAIGGALAWWLRGRFHLARERHATSVQPRV